MADYQDPSLTWISTPQGVNAIFHGPWISSGASHLEQLCLKLEGYLRTYRKSASEKSLPNALEMDLSALQALDTNGAWLINRTKNTAESLGLTTTIASARKQHALLLEEFPYKSLKKTPPSMKISFMDIFLKTGEAITYMGELFFCLMQMLGEVIVCCGALITSPKRIRWASITTHLERIALYGCPIIVVMSFLVGCIIAQQGIFQLQRLGGIPFVVDLVSIITLRELGVLLAAIMVAGRSGSAFTAELGSMKMRDEIDAIRVMGLNPTEILIVPRIIALVIALPILAFIAAMSGLLGGSIVAWVYGGIPPETYISRLQVAIGVNTALVGLIKAPFMALAIGIIASFFGISTKGSAESLGANVTASVVTSIFSVILLDGLFAIFFASVKY
jgi:phospholipid/cholesterol/gamma-HCH transport system permease protein